MTMLVDKCPMCGGEVVDKDVEEVVRGGLNTAILKVRVGVCLHCGERLFSPQTIRQIEDIQKKLESQQTDGMRPVGRSFQVV